MPRLSILFNLVEKSAALQERQKIDKRVRLNHAGHENAKPMSDSALAATFCLSVSRLCPA